MLRNEGHGLRLTRDLDLAKAYARSRYADHPEARYGLLASSKDKILPRYGVDNTFQETKRLKVGPWYNAGDESPYSCRRLDAVATGSPAKDSARSLDPLLGQRLRAEERRVDRGAGRPDAVHRRYAEPAPERLSGAPDAWPRRDDRLRAT